MPLVPKCIELQQVLPGCEHGGNDWLCLNVAAKGPSNSGGSMSDEWPCMWDHNLGAGLGMRLCPDAFWCIQETQPDLDVVATDCDGKLWTPISQDILLLGSAASSDMSSSSLWWMAMTFTRHWSLRAGLCVYGVSDAHAQPGRWDLIAIRLGYYRAGTQTESPRSNMIQHV